MKLLYGSTLALANVLFTVGISQKRYLVKMFCLDVYRSSFAEGTVKKIEGFILLRKKRGTDGEALTSENHSVVRNTWLSKNYFHFCDAVSLVTRVYRNVSVAAAQWLRFT